MTTTKKQATTAKRKRASRTPASKPWITPSRTGTPLGAPMFVAPPVVELPRLPTLGGLPTWREYHGYQPSRLELSAASKAVADLARFVDYRATLGVAAPDPVRLATLLTNAIGWRTLLEELTAFAAYAKAGDGMAWAQAGKELAELKPLFAQAVAVKPALAEMYPSLRDLFDAPRAAGKRSVVTRKANAAAQQAARPKGPGTSS